MEELKDVKRTLMSQVQAQMGDLSRVNTHELGEVIDMVKDLEEAIYYCSIVKAMEEKEDEKPEVMYFREYPPYRNLDPYTGERMYYDDGMRMYGSGRSSGNRSGNGNGSNSMNTRSYMEMMPSKYLNDYREGRSPMARKSYMESKEMHQDKTTQMHELEKYLRELSADVTEIIDDASPEERAILKDKITTLAGKIK